jgi:hypothetical protein
MKLYIHVPVVLQYSGTHKGYVLKSVGDDGPASDVGTERLVLVMTSSVFHQAKITFL